MFDQEPSPDTDSSTPPVSPNGPLQRPTHQWNSEDNDSFEHILAHVDHSSEQVMFEDIYRRMSWKTRDEIREHYDSLGADLDLIDSDQYQPIPAYHGGAGARGPVLQRQPTRAWSSEDNDRFEYILAHVNHTSPALFEDMHRHMAWKTRDEIKEHYDSLVADLNLIDLDEYQPIPVYDDDDVGGGGGEGDGSGQHI